MLTVVFVTPLAGAMEVRVGVFDALLIVKPFVRMPSCPSALLTTTFHVPAILPVRGKEQVKAVVLLLQAPVIFPSPVLVKTIQPASVVEKPVPLIVTL